MCRMITIDDHYALRALAFVYKLYTGSQHMSVCALKLQRAARLCRVAAWRRRRRRACACVGHLVPRVDLSTPCRCAQ